jgi:hypothetical protein
VNPDIAQLLGGAGEPDLGFHTGEVLAWDQSAGTNTIRVLGASMTDLQVVATGSVMVGVGDLVAIWRYKYTYFVMGRIAPVDQTLRVRYAIGTDDDNQVVVGAGNWHDLNHGNIPTIADVYIGPSRTCVAWLSCALAGNEALAGEAHIQVTGASSIPPPNPAVDGRSMGAIGGGPVQVGAHRVFVLTAADGLNQGLNTFQVKYRKFTSSVDDAFFSNTVLVVLPL